MSTSFRPRILALLSVVLLFSLSCQAVTGLLAQPTPDQQVTRETFQIATAVEQATEPPPPDEITEALPTTAPEQEETQPPAEVKDVYPPAFADYPAIAANIPDQAFEGYTLPLNLGDVQGLDDLDLSPGQLSLLEQNGFVVAAPEPGEYREFYQIYESYRYTNTHPLFVTTDTVFHIYHLIFDKMLRDLERDYFIPTLEELTSSLLAASIDQMEALDGTDLEEQALRNVAFFGVAARLLELNDGIPAAAEGMVDTELAFIEAHQGAEISPIWDRPDLPDDKKLIEDYSQYVPRGHYTRSDALKRYFKTMMWYGRLTFRARDAFETQRALLMVQLLRNTASAGGTPVIDLWANIYDPTVFIVGKADDLSFYEYGALSDGIFGGNPDLEAFADPALLDQFTQAVKQLPPPQVNSMWVWIWEDKTEATQGFRFMGQRFTLDAYVFGQLIWRNVGTFEEPRMLPKGLDFFAAMGSEEALAILAEMSETDYANYPEQMEKVRKEVAALEEDSWTQNLYWSWLYAFQPVVSVKDERFPEFMRTQAWTRKDLHTALGSWTELKHDTILYAKQVMAEMGGGPMEEPPKGYVEPNVEAFARLLALAQMTSQGLEQRSLLSTTTRENLGNLIDLLDFLKTVAEKELAREPITSDEYERIRYIGGELEALTLASSDREGEGYEYRDLSDQKAALIADVATGADPSGALVALEEAIGQPTPIYVVLPDQPFRVAVGAVFTYYEFPVSVSDRMTDEAWQEMVEAGTNPPAPGWTGMFIAE